MNGLGNNWKEIDGNGKSKLVKALDNEKKNNFLIKKIRYLISNYRNNRKSHII